MTENGLATRILKLAFGLALIAVLIWLIVTAFELISPEAMP